MRKHLWILLTLAAVSVIALGSCAQQAAVEEEEEPAEAEAEAEEEAEPAAAEEEQVAEEEEAEPAAAAEEMEVCFVHNSFVDDQGWSFAHDRGRQYLEANLDGVTTSYVDEVFDTGGVDAAKVFQDLATQGCDLIFGTSFGYNDPIMQVAENNPDVIFQNYDQYLLTDNVGSFRLATHQGFYINGLVAGMMTEANVIGVVATFPIPQIVRETNAFALGVQAANPDAITKVVWLNSWYDPAREKEAAEGLISAGADVVQGMASSPSVIQAAEENGVYSLGFENDQSEFGPEYYLTSLVFEWGPAYVDMTQSVMDGTWEPDELWYGLEEGTMVPGTFGPAVTDDVIQAVEDATAAMIAGDLEVFAGPITDQEGNVRIPEGETMSIEDMLAIDWFIEGIEGSVSG